MNTRHIALIHHLSAAAEAIDLSLWLQGGWAIDGIHRVTREYQDIDVAFPTDRKAELLLLLRSLGGNAIEETDYGQITIDKILVDCEPCVLTGGVHD